ncbi:MAG: hypothetical protein AAF394_15155 [Planctomycetota bacterium]
MPSLRDSRSGGMRKFLGLKSKAVTYRGSATEAKNFLRTAIRQNSVLAVEPKQEKFAR